MVALVVDLTGVSGLAISLFSFAAILGGLAGWFSRAASIETVRVLKENNKALDAKIVLLQADKERMESHILALESRHLAVETLANSVIKLTDMTRDHITTVDLNHDRVVDMLERIERRMK